MADTWPDLSDISTANFDEDSDTVTGASGAREDLKAVVEYLNSILATVDPGAKIYTTSSAGSIAFKDAINSFLEDQVIKGNLLIGRDVSSTEKNYFSLSDSAGNHIWDFIITSDVDGNSIHIKSTDTGTSVRLDTNMQNLICGATGMWYADRKLQYQPIKNTQTFFYTLSTTNEWTHGNSIHPTMVNLELICTDADGDGGYTQNMRLDINTRSISESNASDQAGLISGIQYYDKDELTSGIITGNVALYGIRRDNHQIFKLNPAKWAIIVESYWW